MDALDADGRADVEFVEQVGADRDFVLPDRPLAQHLRIVADIHAAADPGGLPSAVHLVCHAGFVAQYCAPVFGIDAVPVHVARDVVLVEPAVIQYFGKYVRDRAVVTGRLVGVAVIEVGQTVVADADVEAGERAGAFVGIDYETEAADREAVLGVASERVGAVGRALERHQRGDRDFIAPVHAQSRRVDGHRREVGAERGESSRHRHRAGAAVVERGLRKLEHFGGRHQLAVEQQAALRLCACETPSRKEQGRQYESVAFHVVSCSLFHYRPSEVRPPPELPPEEPPDPPPNEPDEVPRLKEELPWVLLRKEELLFRLMSLRLNELVLSLRR